VLLALLIAAALAFCLPPWASICITLAAVVSVAVGGGALLAKTLAACALAALIVWLWRRRAGARMPAGVKLAAVPESKSRPAQAGRSRSERRAA